MAKTNKNLADFIKTTKGFPKTAAGLPYNPHFGASAVAYDENTYGHVFRNITGTLPKTAKLFYPIIRAAEMYRSVNGIAYASQGTPDYQMVSRPATWKDASGKTIKGKEYLAELLYNDGSGFVAHKKGDEIRASAMEDDGTSNPIGEFKTISEVEMAMIWLVCLPEILEADFKDGSGKLRSKMDDFATFIPEFNTWASEQDVPDLAKECAFYISDAIFCYGDNDRANWSFADAATATTAEQVAANITANGLKGAVVITSNPNVAFKYATSNGNKDGGVGKQMTVGELKQEVAAFSSHRNWTMAERMMIPYFPDDAPVMEETVRIARRIMGTRDAVNPVANVMWRGITSYGKSTGVRQLAYCLNIPLMIMTCHPGMDIMELKSNLVPATEDDGLEVDATAITLKQDGEMEMSTELRMAVDHVSAMEQEDRKAFLSGTTFYMEAIMDPESAAYLLFGKDVSMESEELCKVFADTVSYFREKPLRIKIQQMESDTPAEAPKEEKPGFKHVLSAYMKALINGYLCEIQEPSRIRDSGVLVGTNEYDKAGAVIHLMSGAIARRHKDALVIMTDNVGYASCRPIDPSVLRRQGLIIDSYELTEQMLKDRTRRNTGCKDEKLLDRCYKSWKAVEEYCTTNSITEGSVSPMELERMVQAMLLDGDDAFEQNLDDCIISKATSSIEDQQAIKSAISLT